MTSRENQTSSLDQLLSQLTTDPDAPIRIQMGRHVVYKGTAAQAQTNTLSEQQIANLTQALAQSVGAVSSSRSAISISINNSCIYRSSKADVMINQLNPEPELVAEPLIQEQDELAATDSVVIVQEPIQEQDELAATDPIGSDSLPPADPTVTLSAVEVLMLELHEPDNALSGPTQQWIYSQFPDLAQSKLVQLAQQDGPQQVRNALTHAAQLPAAVVQKGVADSLVALTKQFGELQDTSAGKQFRYEAEGYSVTVRGTNHYTLSDKQGNTLFAFRHTPAQIQVTSPCQLSLSQRLEVIQAGAELGKMQVQHTLKSGLAGLQTVSQSLARLAPAGTRDRITRMQHQQAIFVAETLANTKQAVASAGVKMFSGSHFQVFKSADALRIFAKDGRGELLSKLGNTVRSRMNALDLEQIGRSAETLAKAVGAKADKAFTVKRSSER